MRAYDIPLDCAGAVFMAIRRRAETPPRRPWWGRLMGLWRRERFDVMDTSKQLETVRVGE